MTKHVVCMLSEETLKNSSEMKAIKARMKSKRLGYSSEIFDINTSFITELSKTIKSGDTIEFHAHGNPIEIGPEHDI
jgi:hypothetical protein